ncbi:MAG: hypothetical protein M3015_11620 [Bacteroidota bacterium]|nr:hypothetical protein [Bacteroidota bacterium]
MTTKKSLLIDIISALFILLFVYAGMTKLMGQESFQAILEQSPLIGPKSNILSWLLPTVELFTALLLFIPSKRKLGFVSTFFLMIIFTGYIGYMIFFKPSLPCSCGGVLTGMTWNQHLIFNLCFTALAAIGLRILLTNKFLSQ